MENPIMMPGDDHDIIDMDSFKVIFRFGLHTKLSNGALQAFEYSNKARAEEMQRLLATLKRKDPVRFILPVFDADICKDEDTFRD